MPTAPTDDSYDVDLLVIRAGPTGLIAACALGYHGMRTRVFEQRKKLRAYSQANNVWARPQEVLHDIGVQDALASN